MAPVNGEPFLRYVFNYLLKNGVTHVVVAVGYKAEAIQEYFGDMFKEIHITYSIEDTPLGTGGAIKKALECCRSEDVVIVNGDTYFDVDLREMYAFHLSRVSKLTIAIKQMNNFDRYGSVIIEDDIIEQFVEKKQTAHGKINGGTYIIKKNIFDSINEKIFSFEKVILESGIWEIRAFESTGYFIDIGVPEDYYRAQAEFPNIF